MRWKRDSPSTSITESTLRAVLVKGHPASTPGDDHHDKQGGEGDNEDYHYFHQCCHRDHNDNAG